MILGERGKESLQGGIREGWEELALGKRRDAFTLGKREETGVDRNARQQNIPKLGEFLSDGHGCLRKLEIMSLAK